MNKGLYEAKKDRDQWTLADLMSQREDWLKRNLSSEQQKSLTELSQQGQSWDPLSSIWTSGYFQDSDRFMKEMDILHEELSNGNLDEAFLEGGKQIIMNLVQENLFLQILIYKTW